MIDLTPRVWGIWLLLSGFVVTGCAEEPPHNPAPTAPKVAATPPPQKPEPALVDPYGRLAEGKEKVHGFPIPALAIKESGKENLSKVYRVQALERAVLEFYLHRDYHVIKTGPTHTVRHSSITLDRSGRADNEFATLFITRRGLRDQRFRIVYSAPVKQHIPEVNAEVLEERTDLKDDRRKALENHLPKAKPRANRAPTRPVPPFNPTIPRNVGTKNVSPKVKTWLKKNPGEVFYD